MSWRLTKQGILLRIEKQVRGDDRNNWNDRLTFRRKAHHALALLLFALVLVPAYAQPKAGMLQPASKNDYYSPSQIASTLNRPYKALGDRLQKPGNERITLTGALTDSSGSSSVQIVIEVGGKLRVDQLGKGPKSVSFDGKTRGGVTLTSYDDDLLESLVDDLPETMMGAIARGNGFRLLGNRFSNPKGGFCDLYDVPMSGQTNTKQPYQVKRYCFDSESLLLQNVRYLSGSAIDSPAVETQFSNWQRINNQAVPARVVRIRNGIQVFSFQAQSSNVSASMADQLFGN